MGSIGRPIIVGSIIIAVLEDNGQKNGKKIVKIQNELAILIF